MNVTTLFSLGPINARIICASGLTPTLQRFTRGANTTRETITVLIEESELPLTATYDTKRTPQGFKIGTPFYSGHYDFKEKEALIKLAPVDERLNTQDRRVYGALRCILSLYLIEKKGAALHGCAISGSPGAFVFLGKTGAGKTTLAQTVKAEKVLGDDLVALLPDSSHGFKVFGTPFSGREGMVTQLDCVPLHSISLMKQSSQTSLEALTSPEAVRGVLDHFFVFDDSLATRKQVLKTACKLVKNSSCFSSNISLSKPIWDLEEMR